jgi:hypothetical protein
MVFELDYNGLTVLAEKLEPIGRITIILQSANGFRLT